MDRTKAEQNGDAPSTLNDGDIVTRKEGGRRSALTSIGFGIAGALGIAIGLRSARAEAQGCTDSDGGPYADAGGQGRRCVRVYAPVYQPVVVVRPSCTDADGGPYADGGGRGRRCGGYVVPASCTDNDSGSYADPGGRGRRCY